MKATWPGAVLFAVAFVLPVGADDAKKAEATEYRVPYRMTGVRRALV